MKIKLPEKRFFSIPDLAKRWEVDCSDIVHLVETGQLPAAIKYAALHEKRRIFWGYYGFNQDPSKYACNTPPPPERLSEEWMARASDDELVISYPVKCDFPVIQGREQSHSVYLEFLRLRDIDVAENEVLREEVILLADVLDFEAAAARGAEEPKPDVRERRAYLNIIGGLLELVKSPRPGRNDDAAVVRELIENYGDKYGISESNLNRKFPEAKRSLRAD